MIEIIDKARFQKEVFDFTKYSEWKFDHPKPIILNFFAEWCGPCHQFAPILSSVAEQYDQQLKVYKIDIDKDPEIAALFGVMSVPSTLFLNPREEPVMTTGALPQESIERGIEQIFGLKKQ